MKFVYFLVKMREKEMKQWFSEVPWGKLAMVSWGDSSKPPVLLVHGYVDSAATFIPLVKLLPDSYYYVGFDLPGHGLSDPAPGPPVSYLHFVDVIRNIVEQMEWDSFVCIAHSMGYLTSSYYNAAFPGRMRKLVSLDGAVGIGYNAMANHYEVWFERLYASYYRNYYPPPEPVTYSYDDAISVLTRARNVTEELAAILASRCLQPAGDGKYRFTWDPKVKKISTLLVSFDTLYAILGTDVPTLTVIASEDPSIDLFKAYTKKMLKKLQESKNFFILNVEGGHDVHLMNPESFVEHVIEFLNRDFFVTSKM